jgi:hypothetical protein
MGKDCWNLTRSILADNSPYFESGARISFLNKSGKVYLSALYLNGWQRISRRAGNQSPCLGTQLLIKNQGSFSFNWSTFAGNDKPDSAASWRIFNNFYAQWQMSEAAGLILGFDYGAEQSHKHAEDYFTWYSPVAIVRFKTGKKTRLSIRGEYYSDPQQVIIKTGSANGFQSLGYSANFDYSPVENCVIRVEWRGLSAHDRIFLDNNVPAKENYFVTGSVGLSF